MNTLTEMIGQGDLLVVKDEDGDEDTHILFIGTNEEAAAYQMWHRRENPQNDIERIESFVPVVKVMPTLDAAIKDRDTYIPKEELVVGQAYIVDGRNFSQAIWTGSKFAGLRQKMGTFFIDEEIHWDDDPHFGTCRPKRQML